MTDRPDDLIADLVLALADEEEARSSVHAARTRQAELLRALRAAALPFRVIVHRVTRVRGAVLPIDERLRFAERLRKRTARLHSLGQPYDLIAKDVEPSPAARRGDVPR